MSNWVISVKIQPFSDVEDVLRYTNIAYSKTRACQARDHNFKWEWIIQSPHRNNPHLNVLALSGRGQPQIDVRH